MNKQEIINIAMREVDIAYNIKEGVVKINSGNTLEHELAKAKLMYLTKKEGKSGYSEVIFIKQQGKSKSGRADHFIPEKGYIYEVLKSEKIKQAKEKAKYYPSQFLFYFYTTEQIMHKDFIL